MAADRPLQALIVDDEPLAIDRLRILCAGLDGIEVAGTAADGAAALRLAEELRPDLLLLDVAMPGLDGLQVARRLAEGGHRPAIIFVTAFDHFAVEAFDVDAVDYLMKPVAADRLARALARLRTRPSPPASASTPPPVAPAQEFWVPMRGEMVRVAAADIERVDAERDYMRLSVGSRCYLLHQTISELERRLDPACFLRVHRSTIVRRDRIAKLCHDGLGNWSAVLVDGAEVRIGRTYLAAIRAWMGR